MKIKSKIYIFFILIAGIVFSSFSAFAMEVKIGFNDPAGTVGGTIDVEMHIEPEASGAEVRLKYDTSYLKYVSASGGADSFDVRETGPGKLLIVTNFSMGMNRISCHFYFTALKAGDTLVEIEDAEVTDANGDAFDVTRWWSEVSIREASATETQPQTPPTQPSTVAPTDPPATQPPTQAPTQPTRQASTDACLSQLSIGGGSLQPAFNPNTFEYRMNMDPETGVLQVRYATRDERAEAFYWPYNVVLPYGQTTFTIRVTAEDGVHQNDYTVIINKPQPAAASTVAQTEESTEETTEESTEETSEAVTTERTLPEPTEAEIFYNVEAIRLKILPLPEGFEIPEDYRSYVLHSAGGESMDCLAPKGVRKTDHYIFYGVLDQKDSHGGFLLEPGFYYYDLKERTLRRLNDFPPVTEPETLPTEPSREMETQPTPPPTTQPPTQLSTEADPAVIHQETGGLPRWVPFALAALVLLSAGLIAGLMQSRRRLKAALAMQEKLTPEEESAYLNVHKPTLEQVQAAQKNPAAETPAAPELDFEDLDDILVPDSDFTPPDKV